jgi:hypothetical protein
LVRRLAIKVKLNFVLPTLYLAFAAASAPASSGRVAIVRTPDGGIQPQAAIDGKGGVHLIYFEGDPSGGNIFYVRWLPGQALFSKPLEVNSRPGSAMAVGTIRGAQLAVGKNGRVHVVWDGMGKGASAVPIVGHQTTPLLYTRLNDEGTAFEPERNLITYAAGLDGGSSIAADSQGNVYAVWHAPLPGNTNGEAGRAVFVARSNDEGKTYRRETPALATPTGACPCCGLRAFADSSGAVYILFRAAAGGVNRDELLLVSQRPGAAFEIANAHKWKANTCPMSSAALSEVRGGALAAWETAGQVYYSTVNPKTMRVSAPICPSGSTARKHPTAVANVLGETLLVWTEGAAWVSGGAIAWQLYDTDGKPTSEAARVDGLPVWSLATAFAKPDGDFVIVY